MEKLYNIDFGKGIIKRSDDSYVITVNGLPYHVSEKGGSFQIWMELEEYIKNNNPEITIEVPHSPTLEERKASKLAEINSMYDVATAALVSTYPSTELLTFDKQEAEARAWDADNSASTPLIDALVLGRGIDKAELVSRIIAKADAFAVATGYLTGQRQKYEDQLEAATTAEEIAAIVPEYELPKAETTAEKVKLSPYYDL